MIKIKKLHHSAYRCKNSEQTRRFYVDFLNLQLTKAFIIKVTKSGRKTNVLHTFYTLKDGSSIAFFEDPSTFFEFKDQRDFDLHIAFEVDPRDLSFFFHKGKSLGVETRGIIDHGFIKSIYFRDPNGYVIELSSPVSRVKKQTEAQINKILSDWKNTKPKNFYS